MVTIAHLTEKLVRDKPFIQEALSRGIINYGALADELMKDVEKELGKKVKHSTVMMALRRYKEKLSKTKMNKVKFVDSDITIKSNLFEMTIDKKMINVIPKLYEIVDNSKGDMITITEGIHEITIISNEKYQKDFEKIFNKNKIIIIPKLSSLTIKLPKRANETIGLFYQATRALAWENIPVTEIVSTLTELTLIMEEKYTAKAFDCIKKLIR